MSTDIGGCQVGNDAPKGKDAKEVSGPVEHHVGVEVLAWVRDEDGKRERR